MVKDKTEHVKSKYDKIAGRYDFFEIPMELAFFRRWRKLAISRLKGGKVLEVGVGTGKNLPYYSKEFDVLAIDISPGMLMKAGKKAKKMGSSSTLKLMDAQQLDLPDHSFDSTLSTFVFCSVPDPLKGLRELKRVLKDGGRVVFLEHVRPAGILGRIFDWLNPPVYRASGVNINRDTVSAIRTAGFEIIEDRNLLLNIFKLIVGRLPADWRNQGWV